MRADARAFMDRLPAVGCRCGREAIARRQIEQALAVGIRFGLTLRPGREAAAGAEDEYPSRQQQLPELSLRGKVWTLSYAGRTAHLPDSKGLRYLARLLATPDQAVHATELAAPAGGVEMPIASASELAAMGLEARAELRDEILDAPARAAYRALLAELREVLEGSGGALDPAHEEDLRREQAFLERELRAALGLGGRARRTAGSGERARKAVCNRIRHAVRRMQEVHPELAAHLERSVRTGAECVYAPAARPEELPEPSPLRAA